MEQTSRMDQAASGHKKLPEIDEVFASFALT
jgi:hypothetical protein